MLTNFFRFFVSPMFVFLIMTMHSALAAGAGTYQVAVYGGNANGYGDYQTLTVSIANAGAPAVEGLRWARRFGWGGRYLSVWQCRQFSGHQCELV